MKGRFALAGLLALGLTLAGLAGDGKGRTLDPTEATAHTKAVIEKIAWQTSLDASLAQAKDSGKPVFWMQLKGKLDGLT